MDEFTISVNIADRTYRIKINRENEEGLRNAVKSVNQAVKDYARNYAYTDKQDLLAMVSLEYAAEVNKLYGERNRSEKQLKEKLQDIDGKILKALNE